MYIYIYIHTYIYTKVCVYIYIYIYICISAAGSRMLKSVFTRYLGSLPDTRARARPDAKRKLPNTAENQGKVAAEHARRAEHSAERVQPSTRSVRAERVLSRH